MLILSRKLNESIVIDGRIVVKVLRIDRDTVKLGIQAPSDLPVHRQEIYDAIMRNKPPQPPPPQQPPPPSSQNAGTGAIPKTSAAQVTPPPPRTGGGQE